MITSSRNRIVDDGSSPPLEQLTENHSSLDIEMDVQKRETDDDLLVLPLELITEILSRLPVEPVLRFKCVCKSWYGLIETPHFTKLHVSRSLKENLNQTLILQMDSSLYTVHFEGSRCHATKLCYPDYIYLHQRGRLVGSCNGLLCFNFDDQLALCNPLTRFHMILPRFKSTILPRFKSTKTFSVRSHELLFAYDSISNDFKVLISIKVKSLNSYWVTALYRFKTKAWEIIANPSWGWNNVNFPGVVVSNSLHWMDCDLKQIRCFDLSAHSYYEIPLPEKISPGYRPTLAVLRQQLCVVTYYFDIWILKEYCMKESWTRLFRCPSMEWNNLYKSSFGLASWNNDLSLICSEDGRKILIATSRGSPNFICCDRESKEVREIKISGLSRKFSAILPWVPSLVGFAALSE